MAEKFYWSADHRYGVKISDQIINSMVQLCIKAVGSETGGILTGRYTEDLTCAQVMTASPAPIDSRGGPTWFYRGVRKLQNWLDTIWVRQHQYYLGEWHFHPGGVPQPSLTDIRQMEQISESPNYHCPEPVLLIIGGDVMRDWDIGVYVFPHGSSYTELYAAHVSQQEGGSDGTE